MLKNSSYLRSFLNVLVALTILGDFFFNISETSPRQGVASQLGKVAKAVCSVVHMPCVIGSS